MVPTKKPDRPNLCVCRSINPHSKRILILSDFHSGHRFGLAHHEHCVNQFQKKAWQFFEDGIRKHGPFDVVLNNGDLIDGRARKNGGIELITSNLEEQSDIAIKVLRRVHFLNGKTPVKFLFTRGTPYHTGEQEDWENIIARDFRNGDAKNIDERLLVKISGVTFDLKHKVSSASLPHTRASSPGRDILFAMLKETAEGREKADVFIRSHVHYYSYFETLGRIAITTPALQINSSYGERQCGGITNFGFLVMEVSNGKIIKLSKHIAEKPMKKETVIQL